MLRNKKFLAFIPARKGSKRFPDKNKKILLDKPLLTWGIKAAIDSGVFDHIVVSTNDREISSIACKHGASAVVRPERLAKDNSTIQDALEDYLINSPSRKYDYVQIIEPTCPLLRPDTIKAAAKLILDWNCEVLISLIPSRVPAGICKSIPFHFDSPYALKDWMPKNLRNKQSQQIRKSYQINGYIYILKYDVAYKNLDWWECDIRPYLMNHDDCIDIDDKFDLKVAELVLKRRMVNEDKPIQPDL